jgi:hypothetical protein
MAATAVAKGIYTPFFFYPMCATCTAHFILLDLNISIICVESTSYEAIHYAVFANFLSCLLSGRLE